VEISRGGEVLREVNQKPPPPPPIIVLFLLVIAF
jgi:hypothetical protein